MEEALPEVWAEEQTWISSQAIECRVAPTEEQGWPQTFDMYGKIVEKYTNRAMTYPTDILPAFQGISQVFHALSAWETCHGLVEDVIDFALLWRPDGDIRRRFTLNGDPDVPPSGPDASEVGLPTYSWSAWLGPVTYRPYSYTIKWLIQRFDIVGPKTRKGRIIRFCQNIGAGCFEPCTLEPEAPYAPQDCSKMTDLSKSTNEPSRLDFVTKSVRLILSAGIVNEDSPDGQEEACRRVWLLDNEYRKVGTAWYTSALDDCSNSAVDAILLSKNKSNSEQADGWQFDRQVGSWHEWCLCNVMLIKRLPGKGLCERLSIAKIHERCADAGCEETIRLV
ncbi:MAG: hypothetical protein Q9219_002562 [cf. Caloplaca sp. 3 TL-2023]